MPPPMTRSTRSVKASIEDVGSGNGRRGAMTQSRLASNKRKTRNTVRKLSVTSSEDSKDEAAAEEVDEADAEDEEDSEDDQSNGSAPSYNTRSTRKAGRPPLAAKSKSFALFTDGANDAPSDSDDDELYEAVNDISDDEDLAEEDVEGYEEQALAAEFGITAEAMTADFLADIDGLSAYGFGNEGDVGDFSSSSGSSEEPAAERRVRFETQGDQIRFLDPASPLVDVKDLAASAIGMAEAFFNHQELPKTAGANDKSAEPCGFFADLDEDSDLTDDDLPLEAQTSPSALQATPLPLAALLDGSAPSTGRKDKKSPPHRRGPVRGIFKIDEDKSWGVLDPSGKKINFCPAPATGRHEWLDKKSAEVFGLIASASSSPQNSLRSLLDEDDQDSSSSQENRDLFISGSSANVMMASLNGTNGQANPHGHATGPPEAFYAPGAHIVGDFIIDPNEFDLDEDDIRDPTGEGRLALEDLVQFDDDSSEDEASPTSPLFPLAATAVTPNPQKSDELSHLNSDNIMSFRRSSDLNAAAQMWNFEPPPRTPKPKILPPRLPGKRKARGPPYGGNHYEGTTPITREVITPKRRRLNTLP